MKRSVGAQHPIEILPFDLFHCGLADRMARRRYVHQVPSEFPLLAKNGEGTEHIPAVQGQEMVVDVQNFQRHFRVICVRLGGDIIQMGVLERNLVNFSGIGQSCACLRRDFQRY